MIRKSILKGELPGANLTESGGKLKTSEENSVNFVSKICQATSGLKIVVGYWMISD